MARKRLTMEEQADEAEARVRETVVAVMRYRGYTQVKLADLAGFGRANLNGKLTAKAGTKITIGDMSRLATALDVPAYVFQFEPAEALRWILDHEQPSKTVIPFRGVERRSTPEVAHSAGSDASDMPYHGNPQGILLTSMGRRRTDRTPLSAKSGGSPGGDHPSRAA